MSHQQVMLCRSCSSMKRPSLLCLSCHFPCSLELRRLAPILHLKGKLPTHDDVVIVGCHHRLRQWVHDPECECSHSLLPLFAVAAAQEAAIAARRHSWGKLLGETTAPATATRVTYRHHVPSLCHKRHTPSKPQEANTFPSGLQATLVTVCFCVSRRAISSVGHITAIIIDSICATCGSVRCIAIRCKCA